MTMLWAEPFEPYGGLETVMLDGFWAQVSAGFTLDQTHVRTGDWALKLANGNANDEVRRTLLDAQTTVGMACAIYLDALPATEFKGGGLAPTALFIHQFRDATNQIQLSVCIGTDGAVVVYNQGLYTGGGSPQGALLARSGQAIRAKSFTHIETKAGIDAVNGFVEVRVNGVTVINVTGVNTDPVGSHEVSQCAINCTGTSIIQANLWVDDLFTWNGDGTQNNDFVGDQKVYYLPPNGDTAQADWTPSAGSTSYTMVDEVPPDDNDYLSLAATTGDTDLSLTDLPGAVVAVAAVMPIMRAFKNDAGTCDLAPSILQGATYASGDPQPVTTSAQYYQQVFEVDPVSLAPFTPADVNSLKLSLIRTS